MNSILNNLNKPTSMFRINPYAKNITYHFLFN